METLFALAVGGFFSLLTFTIILILVWYVDTLFYRPYFDDDSGRSATIQLVIYNWVFTIISTIWDIITGFFTVLLSIVSNIYTNIVPLFILALAVLAAMTWLSYHDPVVRVYLVFRQCYTRTVIDFFIFPLANIVRLIYNTLMPFAYFYVSMDSNVKITPLVTVLKCASTQDLLNMLGYFINIAYTLAQDFIGWLGANFLKSKFNIVNTLDAIGLLVDAMIVPLECFCRILFFIPRTVAIWTRLPSLHYALNCILNVIIRVIQIPLNMLMSASLRPDFNDTAVETCCALHNTAEAAEDTVFLLAETGWGLFTNNDLPYVIAVLLSTSWARIISAPFCGVTILVNMTLTGVVHYDGLIASDGSGIKYFQFGTVIDELKDSAESFGQLFVLLNNDAQGLVTTVLWTILDIAGFVIEWIPGNLFYFIFGGPLPLHPTASYGFPSNFLWFYFTDYWLKATFDNTINNSTYVYSTSLSQAFNDARQATQALGNLVGNILDMDPLAGVIHHSLNVIIALVEISANLISFIYTIITFNSDVRTTLRAVNTNPLFNELYFLAGSMGDMFRQYQAPDPITNLTCQSSPTESDKTFLCCVGNFVERVLDVPVVALQQVVNFAVDLIVLPTGTVRFCIVFIPALNYTYSNVTLNRECIRIPDLTLALFLLDQAICEFTCAIFAILPLLSQFECIFPPPPVPAPGEVPQQPKDCGRMSTCGGNLLCKILRIFTAGLHILNTVLNMFTTGTGFLSMFDFIAFIINTYANIIANALEASGLLINCTLCAFLRVPNASPNCDDSFYQTFYQLGQVIRQVAKIVGKLSLIVAKLFLTFIVGFFTGNPIGAVIDFIVGVLIDVFGGLGIVVVNFLVQLFNSIGLGFIGVFIEMLWRGFCPILQTVLNVIIWILKAISFGTASVSPVEFCCSGGEECTPTGVKRSVDGELEAYGLIDGKLYVNVSNWVDQVTQYIQWDHNNPCNRSMKNYKNSDWLQLTEMQQGEVMYCLMKPYWLIRNDSQPELGNSTCDRLMIHYNNTYWDDILIETKSTLLDCMNNRLFTDAIRIGTGATWFPSDWLTNDKRKYYFVGQVSRGLMIYWQFKSDQEKSSEVLFSQTYKENWANMGLNVSHYDQMNTVDDIIIHRIRYRLKDYFEWNNATQYDAIVGMTTGFWSFVATTIDSLKNSTEAMSDDTLDPTTYLSFGYTVGDNIAGSSAAVMSMFSTILSGIQAVATYWSNPDNLKKRHNALNLVKEGGMGIYMAGMEQIRIMGLEYFQYKQHESEIRAGRCPANETQEYLANYEKSMHQNEHSIVYRISHWWNSESDRLLKNYPISSPRDGDRRITYNQTKHLFSYTNRHGKEVSETGRDRLSRIYQGLAKGTVESNRRWGAIYNILTTIKEAIYVSLIQHHLIESVNYVRRVYEKPQAMMNARKLKPQIIPTTTLRRGGVVFGDTFLYHSSSSSLPNNFEILRTEEQKRYCGSGQISETDGLCLDYIKKNYNPLDFLAREDKKFTLFKPKEWEGNINIKNIVVPHELPYTAIQSAIFRAPIYYIDAFLELTCLTNISIGSFDLCHECLVIDQVVGSAIIGIMIIIKYFVNGQFGDSLDKTISLFDYLFDENAYVVVGDGPDFHVGHWPGKEAGNPWYNLRPLGDDTPNKKYFYDIFNSSIITQPTNGTLIEVFGPLDDSYINTWVLRLILTVFIYIFNSVYSFLFYRQGDIQEFLLYLANVCIFCDWLVGDDFLGTYKRTSLGEALFFFLLAFTVSSIIFYALLGFNLFSFIFATSTGLMVFLFLFLTFYANWSWLCWWSLPIILADDIMYFTLYTVLPKCSWFWGFLIADANYDNTNCYSCLNTRSWTFINCVGDLGFGDIIANIVFMFELYYPDGLQWIRDSRIPPISIIYRLPWISSRLNQFSALDLDDPVIYRQYVGCNYIITLVPNIVVLFFFLFIAYILWPAISFIVGALLNLLFIVTRQFFIIYLITADLFENLIRAPFALSGITTVVEEPDYGEDLPQDSEDDTALSMDNLYGNTNNYENARQRRQRLRYNALQKKPVFTERKNPISFSMITNMCRRVRDNFIGDRKTK